MSLKHWPHSSLERTVFTFPREIPQKVGFRKTQRGGRASGWSPPWTLAESCQESKLPGPLTGNLCTYPVPAPAHPSPDSLSQTRLAIPTGVGGPPVLAGGREPLLQGQSIPVQPRAVGGCGRCRSNPCSAICWPTRLSAEEPADACGPGAAGPLGAKTLVLKSGTAQDLRGGGATFDPNAPPGTGRFSEAAGVGNPGLHISGSGIRSHPGSAFTVWPGPHGPSPLWACFPLSKEWRWPGRFPRVLPGCGFLWAVTSGIQTSLAEGQQDPEEIAGEASELNLESVASQA